MISVTSDLFFFDNVSEGVLFMSFHLFHYALIW